jgi:hypothetical protein
VSANDQIMTWLDGIGLAQYAGIFAENAVDFDILPDVTEADLEKMGVELARVRTWRLRASMVRSFCRRGVLGNNRIKWTVVVIGRALEPYRHATHRRGNRLVARFGAPAQVWN